MYKKILIGVDGSEDSERACKRAMQFYLKFGSELIIFHSIKHRLPPPTIPLFFPSSVFEESNYQIPNDDYLKIQNQYEEAGKKLIEQYLKLFKENGVEVTAKLVMDINPADFAKKMVNKEGVELVIVGCKGHHSALKKVFLGSVAEKILNIVDADVLIVR